MRKVVWAFVAIAAITVSASAADPAPDACAKIRGVTIPLTPVEGIGYLMPVDVAGTPRQFLLETGSAHSFLDEAIADQLKMKIRPLPHDIKISDSTGPITKLAITPSLKIGPFSHKDVELLISPHRATWGPAEGTAAVNLFYALDIEMDLAHNRLGLYLPREGCTFQPFWPAVEWGVADYKTAPTGAVYLPMELEGEELFVTFNPTETRSYMSADAARALLGIEADDPRLVPAGTRSYDGKKMFRFPFKALTGGHKVTVLNPEIYIVADDRRCGSKRDMNTWNRGDGGLACFGGGDLQLGINVMKKLHLFYTFKDKKVFFTLAEPPPSP